MQVTFLKRFMTFSCLASALTGGEAAFADGCEEIGKGDQGDQAECHFFGKAPGRWIVMLLCVAIKNEKDCYGKDRTGENNEGPYVKAEAEDWFSKGRELGAKVESDLFERDHSSYDGTENSKPIVLHFDAKAKIHEKRDSNGDHAELLEKTKRTGSFVREDLIETGSKENSQENVDKQKIQYSL